VSREAARAALRALLDARPGAHADHYTPPRAALPLAAMYKIMGRMFAVLALRGEAYVIVKCDPFEADLLRETYAGVGHRSHLDKRFWISIELAADVPPEEIERLVGRSYDLVRASLTRKQRAELESLAQG
jgi:predicted DNA-binding protein (MmcQ/YjbR family)